LPEAAPHHLGQRDLELPRKERTLPAMVALVRYEIRKHMADVQHEIAPGVGRRRRYLPPMGAPKAEEVLDGCGPVTKGPGKIRLAGQSPVHRLWDPNAERLSKGSDPHAPRIVDMPCDRPGCATGRARDGLVPEPGREAGKEQTRHSTTSDRTRMTPYDRA
jgi:hypothetical protein